MPHRIVLSNFIATRFDAYAKLMHKIYA